MTLEDKLKYLFSQSPTLHESNTETCLTLWEYIAKSRNVDLNNWFEMKLIMREYKPEAIVRARRSVVESTKEQRKKEEEMYNQYSKSNPSTY